MNPCVTPQTSVHYANTRLNLCSFQQIVEMTDDLQQGLVCVSGSQWTSYVPGETEALAEMHGEHPTQTHLLAQLASTQG